MNEQTLNTVTKRLDRLERENLLLRRFSAILLIGIAALALIGQAPAKGRAFERESFVVKDPSGQIMAFLGILDGAPALILAGKGGINRAWLQVRRDGFSQLSIADSRGQSRLDLIVGSDDAPVVRLNNPDGYPDLTLQLIGKGSPSLLMKDSKGKSRVEVKIDDDLSTGLSFRDQSGQVRAAIGMAKEDLPILGFWDRTGKLMKAVSP